MNDDFLQKPEESFMDWKLRLIINKIDKVYDIDWSEIVNLLGLNCSSDHLRKTAYGIYEYRDYFENKIVENTNGSDILTEYELRKIELEKEKYKLQSLRVDLNRIVRETSRKELLIEEFINTIKETNTLPFPSFKELQNQKSDKEYILAFADAHFGKEFESITNEYNIDIVYERFNKLLNEVINIIEECNISKLNILALGDLIEGMCLRISQLTSLKIGITQQTIQFMRFMVSWLNKLSENVEIVYYHSPFANHSQIRPFSTKATDFANEDMEKIIFTYIYDMLQHNKRIEIKQIDTKYIMFKIFDFNIIAGHGHDIKNPLDFIKSATDKYKIFFDYAFFAHKHSSGSKAVGEGSRNNCEVINVPSIMGTDNYADNLMLGSKAGATLIEFTEQQGKRKTYDIILN